MKRKSPNWGFRLGALRVGLHARRWCAVAVAALVLAGCASIPNVPTQNILMFNSDGEPIDPTGNLNCPERAPVRSTLCNETKHLFRNYHSHVKGHPRLSDSYYQDRYLTSVLDCMREYFRPLSEPRLCKQEPPLVRPATPPRVKKVLIFIHGGLNSEVGSLKRTVALPERAADPDQEKMYNRVAQEGYYPLFINWSASFASSYLEQLVYIRQGEDWGWTGLFTMPTTAVIDIARGIARAPLVWISQTVNDARTLPMLSFLESKDPNKIAIELICLYQYPDMEQNKCQKYRFQKAPICVPFNIRSDPGPHFPKDKPPRLSPTTLPISVGEDLRGCLEMDISFAMYGITIPSRLLLDPAVDALGTSAWDNMLRRTRLLFNVDDEFHVTRTSLYEAELAERHAGKLANIPRSGGISIFLRRLAKKIETEGGEWEITLVGHSMGTIIINQMLRETLQLKLSRLKDSIRNIVYMAAAASVRDVQDSVLPFLQENRDAKFYNLMLHPIADARESYEPRSLRVPLGPGPRGSLLVLIDNFLSVPLTHLDRTAGRYENFMLAVHAIPGELRRRVHIKTFSAGSTEEVQAKNPQRHSDFTERFKFWMEDCWKPEPAMGKDPRRCVYD